MERVMASESNWSLPIRPARPFPMLFFPCTKCAEASCKSAQSPLAPLDRHSQCLCSQDLHVRESVLPLKRVPEPACEANQFQEMRAVPQFNDTLLGGALLPHTGPSRPCIKLPGELALI